MPKPSQTIVGTQRDRFLVVLVGAVVGYVVGHLLEGRYALTDARIVGAIVGGVLAGVIGRFTLARFQKPSDANSTRRLQ